MAAMAPPDNNALPIFEDLPDEVLSRIFELLSPLHLSWLERVSKRCRTLVVHHGIWRQHCLRAHPAIAAATASGIDASHVPPAGGPAAGGSAGGSTSTAERAGGASVAPPPAGTAAGPAAAGPAAGPAAAGRAGPAAGPAAGAVQVQEGAVSAEQVSAFYKRLHFRLTAPLARESLIAEALAATSTDHPQESVANTLKPSSRSRHLMCYWSSRGSEDAESGEALAFRLAHPLCLVTEVQMRPFEAFFQWGSPIYAPQAVRFRLGGMPCFASDGAPAPRTTLRGAAHFDLHRSPPAPAPAAGSDDDAAGPQLQGGQPQPQQQAAAAQGLTAQQQQVQAPQAAAGQRQRQRQQWVWESPVYPVDNRDELQRFPIPPTLCVGGYLRVELLGKQQRQSVDNQWYTCICYVRVMGSPVYNFMLKPRGVFPQMPLPQQQQQQQAAGTQRQLAYLSPDPLLEAGGLTAVSEGGRLAEESERTEGSESEGDEDDEDEDDDGSLSGDTDDFEFSDPEIEEVDGAGLPALLGPPVGLAQQPGEGEAAGGGGGSGSDDEWPVFGDAVAY